MERLETAAEGPARSPRCCPTRRSRVANAFAPRDRLLARRADQSERDHETTDEQHLRYELAMVALEIATC
jgi:hypothetical protein